MGHETWPPVGWHHPFVIGWSIHSLMLPQLQWIAGSHGLPTAGKFVQLGLCKEPVKECNKAASQPTQPLPIPGLLTLWGKEHIGQIGKSGRHLRMPFFDDLSHFAQCFNNNQSLHLNICLFKLIAGSKAFFGKCIICCRDET